MTLSAARRTQLDLAVVGNSRIAALIDTRASFDVELERGAGIERRAMVIDDSVTFILGPDETLQESPHDALRQQG